MDNLKNKTVMFVDNGLFPEFARVIAKDFGKAYYTSPWQSSFPTSRELRVAEGYPELERTNRPLSLADKVDLWVFLDLYHADLQAFLEKHGARVFGARWGEEMELQRIDFKEYLQKIGLPVGPYAIVNGAEELEKYLADKKNKYIKNDFARGDMETWKFKDSFLSGPRLKWLIQELGPFGEDYCFVVEDEIPGVEIGSDGFSIDGQTPEYGAFGYEVKGLGIAVAVKSAKELPEPVKVVADKIRPALRTHKYRGFMCTEIRYGPSKKPFFIDPCCRLGSPSNEVLQMLFEGWGQTVWEGAVGKLVSPRPVAKYGVVAMVYAEQSDKVWQPLKYPKSVEQWVKLRNPYIFNRHRYSVPQREPSNIAGVVGVGSTLKEAIDKAREHGEEVDGQLVEIGTDAFDKAEETINEGRKLGIKF